MVGFVKKNGSVIMLGFTIAQIRFAHITCYPDDWKRVAGDIDPDFALITTGLFKKSGLLGVIAEYGYGDNAKTLDTIVDKLLTGG